MTPERWKQIEKLYYATTNLEVGRRAAFLDEACAGDAELRLQIASLLAADAQAGSFMAIPAEEFVAKAGNTRTGPSRIGRQMGHYQLKSLLGAGGMGEVYLAQDTRLERSVAIKMLRVEFTTDAARMKRFTRESRAVSALNHPNIITIHEIGEVENTHYIVTEYVAGETLRQRMMKAPQQRIEVAEALALAVQIASALAAAHEAGIIHRDIKPENVMVRPDRYVKVLDFGLAKLTEAPVVTDSETRRLPRQSTEAGMVMGTPRYMSPEQARGEDVDARSDIFSLGVMLYEMIAGCAPFASPTANETIAAILRDEPLPLTGYSPAAGSELERIVNRALQKERTERYRTAGDLLTALKGLQERIDLQAKLGEMASALQPEGAARNVAHRPFGFFAPALRALATWVWRRRQPVLTEKDLLLLANFENKTGDTVFDGTLRQALAIQLQQSPFLSLFPEERVRQTLRLMKRSPEEHITARIGQEICVRHNLKALIAASIAPLGSHYVITLEAIHGQTGETLENEQVEARSKEHVLRALSRATTRLRAKLGESLSSIEQFDKGLEETTTQKLDAFQAYSLGYEQSLSGRMMDAIQLYRRAIELDPDFAYAWSMLSIHHNITGRPTLAAEYAEKAYALKDRVSDYEQLAITFRYHFLSTGDMHKALDAATLFKRAHPRTSTAPIDLLVAYDLIGQHEQALAEGRDAIRLNPNFAPAYWYLGRSLLRVNRFKEAKNVFKQAIEQKFDLTNIHSTLYQIAFAEGDATAMQQQLDWANGKPERFDWQAGSAACTGQWRKSQEFSRTAIDLAARGDTKETAARFSTEQALRGVALEDCQRAKADAEHGLKIGGGRASLPRAALALAWCGEEDQVKRLTDELIKHYPEDTVIHSIWLPTIRAAIVLQTDAARAIDHLQSTSSYEAAAEFWPQYLRGLAFHKLGRGDEATNEFEKILAHRGQAPLSPLYPLAHLGFARAAAQAGYAVKSRQAWSDFLAAWNGADPDLPILIRAKKEFDPNLP